MPELPVNGVTRGGVFGGAGHPATKTTAKIKNNTLPVFSPGRAEPNDMASILQAKFHRTSSNRRISDGHGMRLCLGDSEQHNTLSELGRQKAPGERKCMAAYDGGWDGQVRVRPWGTFYFTFFFRMTICSKTTKSLLYISGFYRGCGGDSVANCCACPRAGLAFYVSNG